MNNLLEVISNCHVFLIFLTVWQTLPKELCSYGFLWLSLAILSHTWAGSEQASWLSVFFFITKLDPMMKIRQKLIHLSMLVIVLPISFKSILFSHHLELIYLTTSQSMWKFNHHPISWPNTWQQKQQQQSPISVESHFFNTPHGSFNWYTF